MKQQVKRGTTSGIFHVRILDASVTTGAGLTGLAFNTAGLLCRRLHSRSTLSDAVTLEDISTLGTYAAPTSNAHMRFKEISGADPTKGLYEIHVHNDWLNPASPIPNLMIFMAGATNMSDMALEVEFVDNVAKDNYDRLGAPTGASVSADIAAVQAKTTNLPATPAAAGDAMDILSATQDSIASRVWSTATRTLTSFGTLVSQIVSGIIGSIAPGVLASAITINHGKPIPVKRGDKKLLTFNFGAAWARPGQTLYFCAKKSQGADNSTAIVNRACTILDDATCEGYILLTPAETAVVGEYHAECEWRDAVDENPETAWEGKLRISQDTRQ